MSTTPALTPEEQRRLAYLEALAQLMRRQGVHALQDGQVALTLGLAPTAALPGTSPQSVGHAEEEPSTEDALFDAVGGPPPRREPERAPAVPEEEEGEP